MRKHYLLRLLALLISAPVQTSSVNADQAQTEIYNDSKFAMGVGAAIVRFDTNIKITDKQAGRKTYLDLEGNLDLPEESAVTTLYGAYQFKPKHRLGFSFFSINRESEIFNIDRIFEDVRVEGQASFTDTTNFYRLDYGYNLFKDTHSKIDILAGVYGLDLKYVLRQREA